MKPIKPSEVAAHKATLLPDFVFKAFNNLIAKSYNDRTAKIMKEEAIKELAHFMPGDSFQSKRNAIFENGYLDIEDCYREVGWDVVYYKPGYNESCDGFYTFRAK